MCRRSGFYLRSTGAGAPIHHGAPRGRDRVVALGEEESRGRSSDTNGRVMLERVSVRLSPALLGRLDELAKARGLSRSALLRALVADAALLPGERVPSKRELLEVLAERARSGNVGAVRMLLERAEREPTDELDELWPS